MYLEYLWATSREKWVKKPHHKKDKCIFCAIARGDNSVPAKIVHKDKEMMVIMNIFPYNPGHLEVVPIRHVYEPSQLTKAEFDRFYSLGNKTVELLKKALNPQGFNMGINIGEMAGASIEHLHMQIVPRFKREVGFMEITAQTRVMPMGLNEVHKILKKHSDILK